MEYTSEMAGLILLCVEKDAKGLYRMNDLNWRLVFRKRLVEYMDRRCISQKELARCIRVSRSAVSSYISGTKVPSVPTLVNIAHALRCRVSDLLGIYENHD